MTTDTGQKIRIQVPDIYKQVNEDVWEELEVYLYQGFLTSAAVIADIDFVFKTVNHHEVKTIEMHRPIKGHSEQVQRRYRATLMAYSVYMIDGENVIHDRPSHLNKLIKIFEKLDDNTLGKIAENLSSLNKRASYLYPLVEVYVHENRSRFKWLHVKKSVINSTILTGIYGTSMLGMNVCQQTWTSLNEIQDIKDEIERDWNNSKFIGSCFNAKGVRPIEEKDRGRREKERQDTEDLKVSVLYSYLNRDELGNPMPPPEEISLPDGRKAVVEYRAIAESVDDLAEQLSASLSGEKDAHDIIVEQALKKIAAKREQVEQDKLDIYKLPSIDGADGDEQVSSVLTGGRHEAQNRLQKIRTMQQAQIAQLHQKMNPELNDGSSIDPEE